MCNKNKEKIKILINIFFCLFLFFSCSKKKEIKFEETPKLELVYREAINELENGNWQNSVDLFKTVELKYSFTEWAPRATLMIMYIYYESASYVECLQYANKFKKLYPVDNNIQYVEYIIGSVFYEQISIPARDNRYTFEALKQFNKILNLYPNSKYAEDVKLKIDLIYEQLAGKEMYIARYYMKKSNWIPAIKRLNSIIDNYGSTIYVNEALHRLVEIYYKLGNIKEAKKYAAILGYNFNDSNWYKKTYKIIGDKDYSSVNKKQKIKFRDRIIKLFNFSNDK